MNKQKVSKYNPRGDVILGHFLFGGFWIAHLVCIVLVILYKT